MFRNSYQKGCFTIFFSGGSNPCEHWEFYRKNGHAKRVHDDDIKAVVMELQGCNVSTMYMYIPRDPKMSLGVKLPFMVLLIKNLNKYFSFEIKIMDDQKFMRRFTVSNFQSKTSVKPFCTAMPMGLSPGWNQVHFNLADFVRRAYGTNYMEVVRLQVHANARIRRIYFTDKLYTEDELPNEYRLVPRIVKKIPEYKVPAARPPSPVKMRSEAASSAKSAPESVPEAPPAPPPPEEPVVEQDIFAEGEPVTEGESPTEPPPEEAPKEEPAE